MLRIRRFEEKCAELYSAGKIRGFLHLYIGEEAVAVGAMQALDRGRRGRGDVPRARPRAGARHPDGPADGGDVRQAGRAAATDAAARCTSSMRTPASTAATRSSAAGCRSRSGLALADKMQQRPRVTACFFGDGAVAEGEFHESLNLAALWKLPVLFLCENNLYAMGTRIERAQSQTRSRREGAKLLMPAESVDGMDVIAVEAATRTAAGAVRRGEGPRSSSAGPIVSARTRCSMRSCIATRSEVEAWKKRDPIATFSARARSRRGLLHDAVLAALETSVSSRRSSRPCAFAEAGDLGTGRRSVDGRLHASALGVMPMEQHR